MSGEGALLEVRKLEVTYHRAVVAVQGVSFRVPEGSVVAILGVNGAGKTTTLRAISGFIGLDDAQITDGSVWFAGEELTQMPPHAVARRGLVLVPERQKIFETLTVRENLLAATRGSRARDAIDQIVSYFPSLSDKYNRVAGYLSGGERQMLAIAQALLCSPRLLMLDEFSLGLAPIVVDELAGALVSLKREMGLTVLVVEQNATVALSIADYGYILENGRIVFEGSPERLRSHEDVKEFYLGMGEEGAKSYREVKQYRRTRRW